MEDIGILRMQKTEGQIDKTYMKNHIGRFYFVPLILLAVFVWLTGCATRIPDPLAGWHFYSRTKVSEAITIDYKSYIDQLPAKERKYVGDISFFENDYSQHAVKIEIGLNGVWIEHVIIYDKYDKRMKTVRYSNGRYAS